MKTLESGKYLYTAPVSKLDRIAKLYNKIIFGANEDGRGITPLELIEFSYNIDERKGKKCIVGDMKLKEYDMSRLKDDDYSLILLENFKSLFTEFKEL